MKALITGIDGQDGSYLAELLLEKGYEVHGLVRRSAKPYYNILPIIDRITLHYGDLLQHGRLSELLFTLQPDELYNLAAQSDVGASFRQPEYTAEVNGIGVLRLLDAVRIFSPGTKVYQASTAEMYGNVPGPQNENTPMLPDNPYAIAKLYAHHTVRMYREGYGLFACCGILFNHESERRGLQFVTRKITKAVAEINFGRQKVLELGNLDTRRDWGYAPDYVEAMWMMLQQDEPDDFVIGTGVSRSLPEFLEVAFRTVGLDWQAYTSTGKSTLTRPTDSKNHRADAQKAHDKLGWWPKTPFEKWVDRMVLNDMGMKVEK